MKEFLIFEASVYFKKLRFYALLVATGAVGLYIGSSLSMMSSPDVSKYAPYSITIMMGFLGLITILFTTLTAARMLLREQEARFSLILYTSPLQKHHYLASRFLVVLGVSILYLFVLNLGFTIGQQLSSPKGSSFHPLWYVHPFLLFIVPNTLFCTVAVCSVAWLTKNRPLVYVAGLFIYIGYMVMLIFSGSPLLVRGMPVSAEAMQISALFDPFGLSAFFQQTNVWSVTRRNSELVQLTGFMLANRALYLMMSCGLLALSMMTFTFSVDEKRRGGAKSKSDNAADGNTVHTSIYQRLEPIVDSFLYHIRALVSLAALNSRAVLTSTPFLLIALGLVFCVSMEIYGEIEKGIRLPERFATTALMVNVILENFPYLCLPALLFYGNELVWRSRNTRFNVIEDATPVSEPVQLFAAWLSLCVTVLVLTGWMIAVGIIFQIGYQYPHIDWVLYLHLYFFAALPLLLSAGVIVAVHRLISNKYIGLTVALVVVAISTTSLGKLFGITHPLIRFTAAFGGELSEMNGWGDYARVFAWKMLFGVALTLSLAVFAGIRGSVAQTLRKPLPVFGLALLLALAGLTGWYMASNLVLPNENKELTKQQLYEQQYRPFQHLRQPVITDVQTTVELFPARTSYRIAGTYTLCNKSNEAIDSILIGFNDETDGIAGTLRVGEAEYKISSFNTVIHLRKPLLPSATATFEFAFAYAWNGFRRHQSFNAIVENGSFMRISRYFPQIGYQSENEITDEQERTRRNLGKATPIKALDAPREMNHFINLDMTISTDSNQTAIGVGETVKEWRASGRNFVQYKTSAPIPFRFGISSAEYTIQKTIHRGISIEVYYHPAHYENVHHLIENAKHTLDYCQENFGAYPFRTIRFAEVSAFTRGFNATAYPATIFMTENIAFHANLKGDKQQDVINELAGHELSHEWWGGKITPGDREGAAMLTETLAMYTELMLAKKMYGDRRVQENVRLHHGLYLNDRGFQPEQPLITTQPQNAHQHYSKGVVVMYELSELIGEEVINKALRNFLQKYSYPSPAPISTDFLAELYAVSNPKYHAAIDDFFKRITTFDFSVHAASAKKIGTSYEIQLDISADKFYEDGMGKRTKAAFNDSLDVESVFEDGTTHIIRLPVTDNRIRTSVHMPRKPVSIELDPKMKFLHSSENKISARL